MHDRASLRKFTMKHIKMEKFRNNPAKWKNDKFNDKNQTFFILLFQQIYPPKFYFINKILFTFNPKQKTKRKQLCQKNTKSQCLVPA